MFNPTRQTKYRARTGSNITRFDPYKKNIYFYIKNFITTTKNIDNTNSCLQFSVWHLKPLQLSSMASLINMLSVSPTILSPSITRTSSLQTRPNLSPCSVSFNSKLTLKKALFCYL